MGFEKSIPEGKWWIAKRGNSRIRPFVLNFLKKPTQNNAVKVSSKYQDHVSRSEPRLFQFRGQTPSYFKRKPSKICVPQYGGLFLVAEWIGERSKNTINRSDRVFLYS